MTETTDEHSGPTGPDSRSRHQVLPTLSKVPRITAWFWLIKILTTGMGEAFSDYLGHASIALAGGVGAAGLAVALWRQLRTTRYVAAAYWFAVVMVAVFGTMAADGLHLVLKLPYVVTTTLYVVALAVVFRLWNQVEGTLSIHSIVTRRRELFYWLAVLATFALGTAAGDLTAMTLHLGYLWSGVIFAGAIAVPALGWWRFSLNPVLAFWSAYVLTRPLGASFADWLGKPTGKSGLGYGDGTVSLVATVLIVLLVAWMALTRRDVQDPAQTI